MEVRERLEKEAGGKRKKGFMTPERKKKLRVRTYKRLCKNIPVKFGESISKCSVAHPKIAL